MVTYYLNFSANFFKNFLNRQHSSKFLQNLRKNLYFFPQIFSYFAKVTSTLYLKTIFNKKSRLMERKNRFFRLIDKKEINFHFKYFQISVAPSVLTIRYAQ